MSITITLPPETEAKIRERAAAAGKDVDAFVREALEQKLQAPRSFKELLAPLQEAFSGHAMNDDELGAMFHELRSDHSIGRPGCSRG